MRRNVGTEEQSLRNTRFFSQSRTVQGNMTIIESPRTSIAENISKPTQQRRPGLTDDEVEELRQGMSLQYCALFTVQI